MNLFGLLRSRPRARTANELAEFIDRQSAFLVQKGIYEYARARSGHYSKVLFREPEFREAVERSRWQAYPLGLAMVGELAEGILRPVAGEHSAAMREGLRALVLAVFDRYPVPPQLGASAWQEARSELARDLDLIALHPPKMAKDIPEPYTQRYFAAFPIHEKLRGPDFPTLRNYLRVTLCNIHDELSKRADLPALSAALQQANLEARS